MAIDVFPKPGADVKKTDLLTAIVRERPDLKGQTATFPGQGQKGYVAIIGDEVFKSPRQPSGECLDDYQTERDYLKQLEGKELSTAIPHITTESKDYMFFGMSKVPGVQMGGDFQQTMTRNQQRQLAKDLVTFIVEMANALPAKDGKFAMHDDLYYNNIMVDPQTRRLTGVIDFGLVKYKSADEWKPMYDFEGTAFYDMMLQEFDRHRNELRGAAPAEIKADGTEIKPVAAATEQYDAANDPYANDEYANDDDYYRDDGNWWESWQGIKDKVKSSWVGKLLGVEAPEKVDILDTLPLPPPGSQTVNFLWMNLELPAPPDPKNGTIRQPLPQRYIANVRAAAEKNPNAEFCLWMDSKRLTPRQWAFVEGALGEDMPNVHLKDLRSVKAYRQDSLYNKGETNPNWRDSGQKTLIWRQVDAAKILISLQGNAEQTFFADLDHAHLDINSERVQRMLFKNGIMIVSSGSSGLSIENQLWGFVPARRKFFETYYESGLACAHKGQNAWENLVRKVEKELLKGEKLKLKDICLPIDGDNTSAEQPGSAWNTGDGRSQKAALVDKGELKRAFNARSRRLKEQAPQPTHANDDGQKKKPIAHVTPQQQSLGQ